MKLITLKQKLAEATLPAQQAMSDPKPNVAPRPKATTGVDSVVRQKMQAAKTTLGMKDVNVSAAAQAHQNFQKLASKNPNVPPSRLMGRLSANQAKSYYSLTSKIPSNQLDPSVSLSKFRNTLRAIKTADQAAIAAAKAANESVHFEDKEQVSEMLTGGHEQNPPVMIVLRRSGIRIFPDGRRVALYDNKQLGLAITIPYKGNSFAPEVIPNVTTEGFDDYEQIAKELVKKHGKNVTMDHIEDLEKERDSRSSLDKDEVMQHVKKLTEAAPSEKEVKMAKGIAYGKRYKGGNMTAAVDAIEKIRPGLSNHPDVKTALRTANEEIQHVNEMDKSQPAAGRDSDTPFPKPKPIKLTDKQREQSNLIAKQLIGLAKANLKKEEVEQVTENLDALAKIAKENKAGTIKFKDGTSTKVHPQVAGIVHQLHGALNPENKKKIENMISHSAGQFDKIADFAVSKSQWTINNK